MSLSGHLGPGCYIMLIGILYALRALRLRWILKRGALESIQLCVILAFAPLAILLEWQRRSAGPWTMTTAHHMVLYLLLLLESALLALWLRNGLPGSLLVAYQAGLMAMAGCIFTAHNMGNALFVGMHATMAPLLFLAAATHLPVTTGAAAGGFGRALEFAHCVAIQVAGQWFFHIGLAFYLFDGRGGLEGNKRDEMLEMLAKEKLNFLLAIHVALAFALLTLLQVTLARWGWILEAEYLLQPAGAAAVELLPLGGRLLDHGSGGTGGRGGSYAKMTSPWIAQNGGAVDDFNGQDDNEEEAGTARTSPAHV